MAAPGRAAGASGPYWVAAFAIVCLVAVKCFGELLLGDGEGVGKLRESA